MYHDPPPRRKKEAVDEQEPVTNAMLKHTLDELNETLQRLCIALGIPESYTRKKMLRRSLLAGIARGLGSAIGFTILGAILISLLAYLANKNLPIIGAFLARLMQMIQAYTPK